jgi:hypothetical protein
MSVLYSQHSLQDSKLASCEEQGPSRWAVALLSKIIKFNLSMITGIKESIRKIKKKQ